MNAFADRLKSVLAQRNLVALSQVQWIGLDMVRRKAGDDWIRISKSVYDVSAQFIESMLSESDALIRARGGFIVFFGPADADSAKDKVEAITEALNGFFAHDEMLSLLGVAAQSETVTASQLIDRVAANTGGSAGPQRFGDGDWRPMQYQEVDPRTARPAGGDAPAPNRHRPGARKKSPAKSKQLGFDTSQTRDSIVFKPCLDAREQRVTAYFCLARRIWHGQKLYSRQILMGEDNPAEQRALDAQVAGVANSALLGLLDAQGDGSIIVPVSFSSISVKGFRKRFCGLLEPTPRPARDRLLVQIDDVPERLPVSSLDEILNDLREFGAQVLVKTPFAAGDLHHFHGLEIDRFGAAATLKANRDGLHEVEAEALKEWCEWTAYHHAEAYLTKADDIGLISQAAQYGVRYFAGDAIGVDCAEPRSSWRMALAQLDRRTA